MTPPLNEGGTTSTSQHYGDPEPLLPSRILSVQAIRGLAALAVLLVHVQIVLVERTGHTFLNGMFTEGRAGVDLFFVLSGFIISFVHRHDVGKAIRNRGLARSYLLKRIIRIYPLLIILTLGKLTAMLLAPQLVDAHQLNMQLIVRSLLALPQDKVPILPMAWTLPHEMLFYLLFLVALFCGTRVWFRLAIGWAAGSFAMGVWLLRVPDELDIPLLPRFLFHPHNMQFFMGCGVAWLIMRTTIAVKWRFAMWLVAAILATAKMTFFWDEYSSLPSCLLWGATFSLVLLGILLRERERPVRPPSWLLHLGDASYSIYLVNTPILAVACVVAARQGWIDAGVSGQVAMAVAAFFALMCGLVCYHIVERPLLGFFRSRLLA